MGFFSSYSGGATLRDPTVDWSFSGDLPTPLVNLRTRQIGPLAFGAPLKDAQGFGRPDQFRRTHLDYLELIYARAGFQLDFEHDRLAYGAFFIGRDELQPKLRSLRYGAPFDESGHKFSDQTTIDVLHAIFGSPVSIDPDEDETVLNYVRNGLVLEFELNSSGRLKRWNLFPETETPR